MRPPDVTYARSGEVAIAYRQIVYRRLVGVESQRDLAWRAIG